MTIDHKEQEVLAILDECLRQKNVRETIEDIIPRITKKLHSEPQSIMAWETIPLELYGKKLPEFIKSGWIFILRANTITGAERHPNSRQRMVSYIGSADFQIKVDGQWQSSLLSSEPDQAIEGRWMSIPVNVWHQGVVPEKDWFVASFHTVPAEQLIEERPDKDDPNSTRRKFYVGSDEKK